MDREKWEFIQALRLCSGVWFQECSKGLCQSNSGRLSLTFEHSELHGSPGRLRDSRENPVASGDLLDLRTLGPAMHVYPEEDMSRNLLGWPRLGHCSQAAG